MPGWLLLFLSVPTVTALIGWVTNWAAVKMIFHPAKFVGIGPMGWQGIIFKQGHKFATGVADMVSENLITSEELVARFDASDLEEIISRYMDPELPETCEEIANTVVAEGTWDKLPEHVKTMIVQQIQSKTRSMSREIFESLRDRSTESLDLHSIVYKQLSGENVERLSRLTKRIGHREFKFIEYYGGIFGFVIGLAQVAVWQTMQVWWLMPIVGVVVGLITNWLALQMIFRPQEPTKYLFGLITYQGLFAKRQKDIARDYGLTAEAEILTPKVFIEEMTTGDNGSRLAKEVMEEIDARVRAEVDSFRPMIPLNITDEMIASAQKIVTRRALQNVPKAMPELEEYLAEKMDVRATVEDKLGNLPKNDFERVLRGIFEEDELTLILVGGFLGGGVGLLQGLLVTSL